MDIFIRNNTHKRLPFPYILSQQSPISDYRQYKSCIMCWSFTPYILIFLENIFCIFYKNTSDFWRNIEMVQVVEILLHGRYGLFDLTKSISLLYDCTLESKEQVQHDIHLLATKYSDHIGWYIEASIKWLALYRQTTLWSAFSCTIFIQILN